MNEVKKLLEDNGPMILLALGGAVVAVFFACLYGGPWLRRRKSRRASRDWDRSR